MAAQQAPPSLGFSRQEYWSGLPFPSPAPAMLLLLLLLLSRFSRVRLCVTPEIMHQRIMSHVADTQRTMLLLLLLLLSRFSCV